MIPILDSANGNCMDTQIELFIKMSETENGRTTVSYQLEDSSLG